MIAEANVTRSKLDQDCLQIRRWILEQSFDSNVGHIGSALSIVEIVAALWANILYKPGSTDPNRDRFILGKGHAALTLYATLRLHNQISEHEFNSYCKEDSIYGVHPEQGVPSVEFATGSLGQSLSLATGIAIALKRKNSSGKVFVLLSDAECNEGQIWEAAMLAAQHQLNHLYAIIDLNGMQAMGETDKIVSMQPMATRWNSFGWETAEVDGHDGSGIQHSIQRLVDSKKPKVIVAKTHLGHGIDFMADRLEWHYRNINSELLSKALLQL